MRGFSPAWLQSVDKPRETTQSRIGVGEGLLSEGAEHTQSAKEVAESLATWAKEHNLFSAVGIEEAVEEDADPIIERASSFASQAVQEILRKRAINLIGFSEPERKVIVFTSGKVNKSDLKILPFHTDGFGFQYVHGGVALVKGSAPPAATRTFHLNGDAYTCGSSIFPAHCVGAGTLGLIARDPATGELFGLSNNHVTGACNNAMPGLPILAPGPLDATESACDPFTIGRHHRLLPINDGIPENIDIAHNCDVGVFKIADPLRVSSMQGAVMDTPAEVAQPLPSQRVQKVGRTTGHTTGKIIAQAATPVPVLYAVNEYNVRKTVYFNDVFIVQGDGGMPFSKPGDSGSLVVGTGTDGKDVAVGIVFAGNEPRGHSFILPLPGILSTLGLEIVSGHNA